MEKSITIIDQGTIVLLFPRKGDVSEWIEENVSIPDYMRIGETGFACERRYAIDIVDAVFNEFGQ